MRWLIQTTLICCIAAALCSAATAENLHTVVGNLQLQTLHSKALHQSRTIRIWLPPGYNSDQTIRYSVLYMQDGQNCFDRATSAFGHEWEIDETLTKLIAGKTIPPLIVVGIDNGQANRINEYTFDPDPKDGGGKAAIYADFLLHEVQPFIEKNYRTLPGPARTFIGGSSLGALVSLEIARRHPGIFGGVIAMSPSLWWDNQNLTQAIEHNPGGLTGARIWLDIGTRESGSLPPTGGPDAESLQNLANARSLDAALTQHGIPHRFAIDDQHPHHNEIAWASRFPAAITYLLGTAQKPSNASP